MRALNGVFLDARSISGVLIWIPAFAGMTPMIMAPGRDVLAVFAETMPAPGGGIGVSRQKLSHYINKEAAPPLRHEPKIPVGKGGQVGKDLVDVGLGGAEPANHGGEILFHGERGHDAVGPGSGESGRSSGILS